MNQQQIEDENENEDEDELQEEEKEEEFDGSWRVKDDSSRRLLQWREKAGFGRCGGFSRTDALVVMAFVALAACVWLPLRTPTGEKRRTLACAQNLVAMGKAMHEYALEHAGCLPPAAISNEQGQASWDLKIKDYLPPRASSQGDYYADLRQRRAVTPIFKCPSDSERRREHEAPRSYAMSLYDPRRGGVQPSAESPTGVGIRFPDVNFNECAVEGGRSPERAAEGSSPPVIRLSIVTEPGDTLLLTEHISPANALWNLAHATVADTSDQLQSQMIGESAFHGGRFNYLMIDGHVEALTPIETVGHVGQAGSNPATHYGIWTIRPGD